MYDFPAKWYYQFLCTPYVSAYTASFLMRFGDGAHLSELLQEITLEHSKSRGNTLNLLGGEIDAIIAHLLQGTPGNVTIAVEEIKVLIALYISSFYR